MFISPPTPQRKPSLLALLVISLVTLFSVGCGDSRDEYVYTGNPPAPNTTGNLTFQFQQQQVASQQAGIVPTGTTSLQFEFFSSTSGNSTDLVHEDTAAYANQVTITGVPASAVFVRVTAYGANGVPLAVFTGSFEVAIGSTVPVDLGAPTAVTFDSLGVSPTTLALSLAEGGTDSAQLTLVGNFSNGQSVAFPIGNTTSNVEFSSSDENVATVSDRGLVEAVGNGNTTVTASYTLGGVTRSTTTAVEVVGGGVTVDTLTVSPSTLTLQPGTSSGTLNASFTAAGTSTAQNVTGSASLSYALLAPVEGIAVDNSTGVVSVASEVSNTTTATVVATYTTPAGSNVTDTVAVSVGTLRVVSYQILLDGDVTFPEGTEYAPILLLQLSNAQTLTYVVFQAGDFPFEIEVSSSDPSVVNTTNDGWLTFQEDAGNQTATVTFTVDGVVSSFDATSLDVSSTTFQVVPSAVTTTVGNNVTIDIVLDYGDGFQQELGLFSAGYLTTNQLQLLPGSTATGSVAVATDADFSNFSIEFAPTGAGTALIGFGSNPAPQFLPLLLGGSAQAGAPATILVNP